MSRSIAFAVATLVLFGTSLAPTTAAPLLSTATLHRLERVLKPALGPSLYQAGGRFAALKPLRPVTPGNYDAALSAQGNGRTL